MQQLKTYTENAKTNIKSGLDKLLEPHEYHILVISTGIGIAIEQILDTVGIDVKDIPSDTLSEPILYTSILATLLPLFRFSTGKDGDFSSRAKVNYDVLQLAQNGDVLRGTCNMMYESAKINEDLKLDNKKAKELLKKLKYTYLAAVLLASYIMRWEQGACFESFTEVCKEWKEDGTKDETKQETQNQTWYIEIFQKAINDTVRTEGFKEKISAQNVSFIVEVINQLEDNYNSLFVEFSELTGMPINTLEEALAISERSVKPEEFTLDFLKQKARGRKALFYTLIALSAISMNKPEEINNIGWLQDTFLKGIIDYVSAHSNAIVATTITFISLRVLGTLNSNNVVTNYLGRRLIPSISRIELEKNEPK